jgi:hypothetical protein
MSCYAEELATTNDSLARAAFLQKPITLLISLRKLREALDASQEHGTSARVSVSRAGLASPMLQRAATPLMVGQSTC